MFYRYGLLRQDVTPEAARHNGEWLGPDTLGIEVTSDAMAARCGLGNIDPQHQFDGRSSAIEDALAFPLPKEGTKLVTIRPDKDSIGAMAVLTLRAEGRGDDIDKTLVSWIGACDRLGYGNALREVPDLAAYFGDPVITDALNVICLNSEVFPAIGGKVHQVGRILCGKMSQEELKAIQGLRKRVQHDYIVEIHGDVAFLRVSGELDAARNWANHHYPVAVIYDDCHRSHGSLIKKWSVIRKPDCFERQAFEEAINLAEAEARGMTVDELRAVGLTWGGTKNIVSSPPGVGRESKLVQETILRLVMKHFEPCVAK